MEFRDKPMQNLVRIKEKEVCKNVQELLLDSEQIVGAYKTVRDQAVFTTHRILMVDMQGVTGTRQAIFVLPYRKILHFGIQTADFLAFAQSGGIGKPDVSDLTGLPCGAPVNAAVQDAAHSDAGSDAEQDHILQGTAGFLLFIGSRETV